MIEISSATIKKHRPIQKFTKLFELLHNIVLPSQFSLVLFMLLGLSVANGGHDPLAPHAAEQQVYHQQHEQYSGDDDSDNSPTRQCRSFVTVNLCVPTFVKEEIYLKQAQEIYHRKHCQFIKWRYLYNDFVKIRQDGMIQQIHDDL